MNKRSGRNGVFRSISMKILSVFIIMILPLNILTIFLAESMINTTVEHIRMTQQNIVELHASNLAWKMEHAAAMLHYFHTENVDCLYMMRQKTSDYEYLASRAKLNAQLKETYGMIDGADAYYFYFPLADDVVVYSERYIGQEATQSLKAGISAERESKLGEYSGWYLADYEGKKFAVLTVHFKNISYGAWIELDKIEESVLSGLEYHDIRLEFSEEPMAPAEEKNTIMAAASAKNLWLNFTLNRDEIVQNSAIYPVILLQMAISYLLLIPVLFTVIRRILIRPLQKINLAHLELQNGNQDYRITETAESREFEDAYQSFNQMAGNLQSLRIQAYESRIEKQQMELRNLQLQIRPHFLLNTFNLIISLTKKGEYESIQNIIMYLSEYFRYVFRSEKELELFSRELKLIDGYIQMAAIRYDQMVELSIDIDPELQFVRMPPLLIHNFIENAVKYGLCKGKVLHIDLTGRYDDRFVMFTILDDGNGMDEEMLERNQKMFRQEFVPEEKNAHLGLYNSLKRLKYFYGDTAEIEVESKLGEMTCFTISFPYDLEVQDDSLYSE